MAKKAAVKSKDKPAIPGPKPAEDQPQAVNVEAAVISLAARVTELEADLKRIAKLCGDVWGEPLASEAMRIASKVQG